MAHDPSALWSAEPGRNASGTAGAGPWFQLLDLLSVELVLVDARAHVLFANRAARARGRAGPGALTDCLDLSESDALRLLGAVRSAAGGQWTMLQLAVAGRMLRLGVSPVSAPTGQGAASPPGMALLTFERDRALGGLALEFFCQQHRLTKSEHEVLIQLDAGLAPEQVAAQRGVALSTVRSQISSIRLKTRTNSLYELLQAVDGLPPLLAKSPSMARPR